MRSRKSFVTAGVIMALVMLAVQSASAQSGREKKTAGPAGWLGVSIQDVTSDIKEALPRGVTDGAIVNSVVEDSPADDVGLKEGDIITRFNGTAVHDADDLTAAVRDAGAGKLADIEYYRDGRRMRDRVTLGESAMSTARRSYRDALKWVQKDEEDDDGDDEEDAHAWIFRDDQGPLSLLYRGDRPARLGVRLMDLGDQLASYFKVEGKGGVLVTEVVEESPAAKAGILAGDVIVAIDDQAVTGVDDVLKEVGRHDEAGPVAVQVIRSGRSQTFTAELEKRESRNRRFGMRAPRMEHFYLDAVPDASDLPAPRMGIDREELREQMQELRRELKDLRKELSELRSKRP